MPRYKRGGKWVRTGGVSRRGRRMNMRRRRMLENRLRLIRYLMLKTISLAVWTFMIKIRGDK